MKTTTYRCDGNTCDNETFDIENNNWIEIGSEESRLFINNYFKNRKIISVCRYDSIHFCSPECLTNYFFTKKEHTTPELLNPSNN